MDSTSILPKSFQFQNLIYHFPKQLITDRTVHSLNWFIFEKLCFIVMLPCNISFHLASKFHSEIYKQNSTASVTGTLLPRLLVRALRLDPAGRFHPSDPVN